MFVIFGFCLLPGCMLFLAESLSSPGAPNLGYMYPWGYICLSQEVHQERNEVRWRPGQEASLSPPCSKRVFRKQMYCIEECACYIVGIFGTPAVILPPPPHWLGARGIAPPSLHLWVYLLNSRNKLTSRYKIHSNDSSINIQWNFVVLISLFVIKNFRGTSSPAELMKGYMVRETLGTPALTCGNIFP